MSCKIIEFGSALNSGDLAPHTMTEVFGTLGYYDEYQSTPLDGCIFNVENNSGESLQTHFYSTTPINIGDLSDMIDVLRVRKNLGFGRTQHNFAYLGVSTGPIDWFSIGADVFIGNFSLMGDFVGRSGITGIFFDPEPYASSIWKYSQMPRRNTYSFSAYRDRVYKAAREIATNWRTYSNDLKIMIGKSYLNSIDEGGEDGPYGLWDRFLDGLLDEMGANRCILKGSLPFGVYGYRSNGHIILTNNETYICETQNCVETKVARITGSNNSAFKNNNLYFESICHFGTALWIDSPGGAFDNITPSNNTLTPIEVKNTLGYMVDAGMEWIWIFNQYHNFFNSSQIIHTDYITALRDFRNNKGLL